MLCFVPVLHGCVWYVCCYDKLKNKSSSGYDGISNTILKSIKSVIIKPLTLIINQMVETGIFPDVLKISKVIPIYKKGDVSLLSNYRPISLLPTLSKIFERVIYNQLYNYFVRQQLTYRTSIWIPRQTFNRVGDYQISRLYK